MKKADGKTPLHHAVARRDADAVKKLLEAGADYERNDSAGYPPTAAMFEESLSFDKWIDFKVKKGFKRVYDTFIEFLHHPKCKGSLTFVNQEQLYNGIIDRSLARVKDALTNGGVENLDIRLADGTTPLHLAAKLGEPRIVKELLANGADPRARDKAGRTPRDVADAKVAGLFDKKQKTPKRPKTLEDRIVAEVVDAVRETYELERYEKPLESILLVGDEVSCSTLYLNVPGLQKMKRVDETGGRRVEGRFMSEDDAFELEAETGTDVMEGVRDTMVRVAAQVETTMGVFTAYVDHSMNDFSRRQASSNTSAKAPGRKSTRSASRRSARPRRRRP